MPDCTDCRWSGKAERVLRCYEPHVQRKFQRPAAAVTARTEQSPCGPDGKLFNWTRKRKEA